MHELDEELWKLGVPAKTKHNEVAPSQHELAPVFDTANVAVDHNQLTMEIMKKVADKHGLACLIHEKPFEGINGSGKHNNWSISTDTGVNLLDPGKQPAENVDFLLFLAAIIKAVDDYADMMRVSVASAGNDHRLGANEAPPAIVSIFLGDELTKVLKAVEKGVSFHEPDAIQMETGAHVIPHFMKDNTDRNRTSPFAFTGNKFEFRMPGSALSVAGPNVVLNTAVSESLQQFNEVLGGVPAAERREAAFDLIRETIKAHKRIIFNGNGYTDEWVEEAEKRGLYNLKSLPDAMPRFIAEKNIALFTKHHIFTKEEIFSRYDILLENYSKAIHVEAKTMIEMMEKDFIPALIAYTKDVAAAACQKKALLPSISTATESTLVEKLTKLSDTIYQMTETLKANTATAETTEDVLDTAKYYHTAILEKMNELREFVDAAEALIPDSYLPYPTYDQLLFSV